MGMTKAEEEQQQQAQSAEGEGAIEAIHHGKILMKGDLPLALSR